MPKLIDAGYLVNVLDLYLYAATTFLVTTILTQTCVKSEEIFGDRSVIEDAVNVVQLRGFFIQFWLVYQTTVIGMDLGYPQKTP